MLPMNPTIWILDRDAGTRALLARIARQAAPRHDLVIGDPEDPIFDSAPKAEVVVLGIGAGDFEAELEFSRWATERLPRCAWILVADPALHAEVSRLFDSLEAQLIAGPPRTAELAQSLDRSLRGRGTESLSGRLQRDRLAARFARWFGRDEPADLAHALEPRMFDRPLLVQGEPGTGRGLLLRYAHAFSAPEAGPLIRVSCRGATRARDLSLQLEEGIEEQRASSPAAGTGCTAIWLEDLDQLPLTLQMQVLDWVELGLPGRFGARRVRWTASVSDNVWTPQPDQAAATPQLDPRLAEVFGELLLRLQPLRSRPEIIAPFAEDTARAWSTARSEPILQFEPEALRALREDPWVGNLHSLEAVVLRTLAHAAPNLETLGPEAIRWDEGPTAPEAAAGTSRTRESERVAEEEQEEPQHRDPEAPGTLQRLAAAVAHEIRNPLVSIRTFAELLPENYRDDEFRARFSTLVAADVQRIEDAVARLQGVAETQGAARGDARVTVDVTVLLDELLETERSRIRERQLLVLKELERERPNALADLDVLREALATVLDRAFRTIPERGDLYIASMHHPADGPGTPPTLRILFRYRIAADQEVEGGVPERPTLRETDLGHAAAEASIRAQGGTLTVDNTDASETLVVIDIPAPADNRS